MKKIRKFYEYLEYDTYLSAYNKLLSYGQRSRADKILNHANYMKLKSINDKFRFKIKHHSQNNQYIDVKFNEYNLSILNDYLLFVIGFVDDNKHKYSVSATIDKNGIIHWFKNNKFYDKKSVMDYYKLIKYLYDYDENFRIMINKFGVNINDLNIVYRTFYE